MRVLHVVRAPEAGAAYKPGRFVDPPAHLDWQRVPLDRRSQCNLPDTLAQLDMASFERVVIELKWAWICRTLPQIQAHPGLIVFEYDAWFDQARLNRYYKRFTTTYTRMPPFRLLCSSATHTTRFRSAGIDAVFMPKSYSGDDLYPHELTRDITFGFVGITGVPLYRERDKRLAAFARVLPLSLWRTQTRDAYATLLNRIAFFISADVGAGEYMIKNFEAMACGCILVAWRQGNGEEEALGLRDMHNVVLYRSVREAVRKIRHLQRHPALANAIRSNATAHARRRFALDVVDRQRFSAVEQGPQPTPTDRRSPTAQLTDLALGHSSSLMASLAKRCHPTLATPPTQVFDLNQATA